MNKIISLVETYLCASMTAQPKGIPMADVLMKTCGLLSSGAALMASCMQSTGSH